MDELTDAEHAWLARWVKDRLEIDGTAMEPEDLAMLESIAAKLQPYD